MKTGIVILSILIGSTVAAQNSEGTSFGLRAGVNFQNINGKDAAGNNLKNKLLTGFNGGVNAEIPIGSSFYVQPGVLYSMKGTKGRDGSKTKINYIEVPVNFIYKPELGTGNLLLGFGPYAAFGIGGQLEYSTGVSVDMDFGGDFNGTNAAAAFKSFDAGGNLLAGYQAGDHLSFQLNAQLGLMNINKDNPAVPNDKTRWRNTGWGLSLGYRF